MQTTIVNDQRAVTAASNIHQISERKRQRDRLETCRGDLASYVVENAPKETPVHTVNAAIHHGWNLLEKGTDYPAAESSAMEFIEHAGGDLIA